MEGDGGIETGLFSSMQSQGYRLSLYEDWVACKARGREPEQFAKNKGITIEEFTAILKEFRSLDPDRSKWGVS